MMRARQPPPAARGYPQLLTAAVFLALAILLTTRAQSAQDVVSTNAAPQESPLPETSPDSTSPGAIAPPEMPDPNAPNPFPLPPTSSLKRRPEDLAWIEEAFKIEKKTVFSRADLGFNLPRISILDAVDETLASNPQILLQNQSIMTARGTVQTAEGVFDTHLTGTASANIFRQERTTNPRSTPTPTPGAAPGAAPAAGGTTATAPASTPTPNPFIERRGVFTYETGLLKRLDNGVVVNPSVSYSGTIDKDLQQYKGFQNKNVTSLNFAVQIPLGKGGGAVVNKAPEISARFDLLATVLQLRFTSSQSVFSSIQAYWGLVAAEKKYDLAIESETISEGIAKSVASMVRSDEIQAMQLPQALADRETTTAQRIQSGSDLIAARQTLALAIGKNPDYMPSMPLAKDPFPDPPKSEEYPELGTLLGTALSLRDDLRALQQTVKSKKTLLSASYLELRPTINLQLIGKYQPDQQIRTSQTITTGPSWEGSAQFSFDWPLENNSAIGNYLQAEAAFNSSKISVLTSEQNIVSSVISALAAVKSSASNVSRYARAVRYNQRSLNAQQELFRLGNATLTDVIIARRTLVQSQLDEISAQANYAVAIAQLRFSTGTLFFSDSKGDWIDNQVWNVVPFARAKSASP